MDSNRFYLVIFAILVCMLMCKPMDTFAQNASLTTAKSGNSSEEIYALAASFYSDQNWSEAASQFRLLIERHPKHELSLNSAFYLGESLVQLNLHGEGEKVFLEFLNDRPDNAFTTRARFRLAECKYLNREYEAARDLFDAFMQQHGSHPLAEFALPYLGELQLRFNDAAAARDSYQSALNRFPNSTLANKSRLGLAQALGKLGDTDEATRFYRFLINQPSSRLGDDARMLMGKMYAGNGDWNKARTEFDLILRNHPDSEFRIEAQYLIARAEMASGNWQKSWSQLEKLLQEPLTNELQVHVGLDAAIVAIRLKKFDQAKSLVKRVRQHHPAGAAREFASVVDIDIASRQKDMDWLERLVNEFEVEFGNSVHITRCIEPLARMHYDRGEYAPAARRYQQLVELVTTRSQLDGNLSAWRYLLGLSRIGTGEFADALKQLRAIDQTGDNRELESAIAFAVATALSGQKEYKNAIAYYQRYLAIEPNGEDAVRCHADLAIAQIKIGNSDAAIKSLDIVIPQQSDDLSVLSACEIVAEEALGQGDRTTARRFFSVLAKSTDPGFAARGATGLTWSGDESMLSAERLNSLVASGVNIELALEAVLGQVQNLQAHNEHQRSIDILENIVNRYPASRHVDEARFRLAVSLQRIGGRNNCQRAVQLLDVFLRNNSSHALAELARYEFGWALHDNHELERARQVFEDIADRHTDSPYRVDACYRVAMMHKQNGNVLAASQRLGQLVSMEPDGTLASYARYTLGEFASNRKDWKDAVDHFQSVVDTAADPALTRSGQYWLAESHYQSGTIDQAEKGFADLKHTDFGDHEISSVVWLRLAQCAAKRLDWKTVEQIVRDRKAAEDNTTPVWQLDYLQGRVFMSQGRFDDARQTFGGVLQSPAAKGTRTAAMCQWMIGETWFHQENYRQALRAYLLVDSLYSFEQWRGLALLQAAKCHGHLGDSETAIKTCKRMLKTFPKSEHADQAQQLLSDLTAAKKQVNPKHIPANFSR